LSVGGYLDLQGTQITALPDGLSCEELLFRGNIDNKKFEIIDGIGCVVLSVKSKDGMAIKHCQKSQFKDGTLVGEMFYAASQNETHAHGKTVKEAIEELAFKTGSRDISQYQNMPMETIKTPDEWAFIYRMITGACQYGTKHFMASKSLKKTYSLREIIAETKGAFGHKQFVQGVK
jgi:hypothetical protein